MNCRKGDLNMFNSLLINVIARSEATKQSFEEIAALLVVARNDNLTWHGNLVLLGG